MAAAAIPALISTVVPILFKIFGSGKNAETKKAEAMPDYFFQVMKDLLQDANLTKEHADIYWNHYVGKVQEMQEQGFGSPEEIMGRGSTVIRDEGQEDARKQETKVLDERFRNGPNAETTWGDVSAILDQMGIGAGATFDAAEGLIRDSNGRILGEINDVEKKILEMTGSTFDAATAIHDKLYGELRTRMGAGFTEQRGQLNKFETDATRALEGEYKVDANAALDKAFNPDATSARTGRAFAPAAAAAAFRARRAGLGDTDPTYNAMQSRVEASRSRAVDDALSLDAEKLAQGRLGISNKVLDTRLGIGGKVLDTGLSISRDEMGKDINLSTADEAIRRGLILDRGAIDRDTVDTAATRRINEDIRTTGLNLNNTYRYQDESNKVYAGRIAAATDKLTNSRADLAIAAGLADRRNEDREYGNQLRERQYNLGMGFTKEDLARKDRGTAAEGAAASSEYDRAYRDFVAAGGFGQQASQGYNANAARANAAGGGFSSLVSGLAAIGGRAATDYFAGRGSSGYGMGEASNEGSGEGTRKP
jgi:hypothetical protein